VSDRKYRSTVTTSFLSELFTKYSFGFSLLVLLLVPISVSEREMELDLPGVGISTVNCCPALDPERKMPHFSNSLTVSLGDVIYSAEQLMAMVK
jgi:hypothetical protein